MTRVRVEVGIYLCLDNCEYIIQERKGNKFKLLEESTGKINWLSEKELVQHFFAGQLNFPNKKKLLSKSVNHYYTADFSALVS